MSMKGYIMAIRPEMFNNYEAIFKKFKKCYTGFYEMSGLGTIKFTDEQIEQLKENYDENDLRWLRADNSMKYIIFAQYDQPYTDAASIFALYDLDCWKACKWTQDELYDIHGMNGCVVVSQNDFLFPSTWDNFINEYQFVEIN